ncbi:BCS1 and AAA domain-containing protein [Aspergillus ibericus CBS 121593]|uniref:P-loop containing nucleoside triphosphate hydrolase protein n=1 Tax=Aspergillus ibericus CBS 121593 TaxID=1448316 RepID=A0A395GHW9_9EURO|nr:P-loop containing nucleoside triphosphate hydrolase protein [Aspergillus ibericus CBS 121593]RAK94822.1 P-loop containing nucleoside triphosphate hydrolase protein [Aspergillus ibericus CBS 121593]
MTKTMFTQFARQSPIRAETLPGEMNSSGAAYSLVPIEAILDTLLPGYSFYARLMSLYSHANVSFYLFVFIISLVFCICAGRALSLWDRLQSFLLSFAASVEIRYHDIIYRDVMNWISQNPALTNIRRSVASSKTSFVSPWATEEPGSDDETDYSEEEILRFENDLRGFWMKIKQQERRPLIRYSPAPAGIYFFVHKRRLFGLRRQMYQDTGNPWTDHRERLYFYASNPNALKDLLRDIQRAALEKNVRDVCVNQGLKDGPSQQWFSLPSKKTRPLSTVVIDPEIKSNLLKDMEGFFHPRTRYWYDTRGIPYRRGYLFHGPPGTGKSSLCLAMASLIDLEIYTVSLNSKTMNGDSLTRLFLSLPKRCLVLFEDVDQAGIEKRSIGGTSLQSDEVMDADNRASDSPESSEHSPSGITLSEVLNIIDGVSAQEGRILIMTTNKPLALDEALRRPGRVDVSFPFKMATRRDIKEHFLSIFTKPSDQPFIVESETLKICCPLTPESPDWSIDSIIALSDSFADQVPPNQLSAATLQNYLERYRADPESANMFRIRNLDRRYAHEMRSLITEVGLRLF